jgi:hypothetical protein
MQHVYIIICHITFLFKHTKSLYNIYLDMYDVYIIICHIIFLYFFIIYNLLKKSH